MILEEKKVQARVGIFMLIGLLSVGMMVVYFGRLGDGMRSYYPLNVQYSNASGLKKGADVLLGGARVGQVANAPTILPNMRGVNVSLMIYKDVLVPENAHFTIGSSGLLGDRFVDILIEKDISHTTPLTPGATVQGDREASIGDIISTVHHVAQQASGLIDHLDTAVQNVDQVARKINGDLLKTGNIKSLRETIANLKLTSENFANASKKMDSLLESTNSAITEGKKTLTTAGIAAGEFRKTAAEARRIFQQAQNGNGTLNLLLNNKEFATSIRILINNMRRHGILFYKDTPRNP